MPLWNNLHYFQREILVWTKHVFSWVKCWRKARRRSERIFVVSSSFCKFVWLVWSAPSTCPMLLRIWDLLWHNFTIVLITMIIIIMIIISISLAHINIKIRSNDLRCYLPCNVFIYPDFNKILLLFAGLSVFAGKILTNSRWITLITAVKNCPSKGFLTNGA